MMTSDQPAQFYHPLANPYQKQVCLDIKVCTCIPKKAGKNYPPETPIWRHQNLIVAVVMNSYVKRIGHS